MSSNPTAYSGSLAHQSANATGSHQHFFVNATATLSVSTGDVLYAYVYLDPAHLPSEIMLQWNDGSWEHRAYWGADQLGYGIDGTASRRYMGPLPAAGQWVQLKVPANRVNLQGSTLNGMAFTLYNGRATWDAAGLLSQAAVANTNMPTITVGVNQPRISRIGLESGVFTVTRTGATNMDLTVNFVLSGSAQSGLDYQAPATPVIIRAGATSAAVGIVPLPATNFVGSQTVVLTLASNAAYAVGVPSSATLSLAGNTVAILSVSVSAAGARVTWASISNGTYQVVYKNDLSDASWTPASASVLATNSISSWLDAAATTTRRRFYLVAQTN